MTSKKTVPIVEIFTDGACSGNPGPGGYCAILRYKDKEKTIVGADPCTTNNKMELTAVIEALEALKKPSHVKIVTDSQYVVKGATEWLTNWIKHNWKNAQKKEVKNKELWQRLLKAMSPHKITWEWVEGHKGHVENETCDKLAVEAMKRLQYEK